MQLLSPCLGPFVIPAIIMAYSAQPHPFFTELPFKNGSNKFENFSHLLIFLFLECDSLRVCQKNYSKPKAPIFIDLDICHHNIFHFSHPTEKAENDLNLEKVISHSRNGCGDFFVFCYRKHFTGAS